MGKTQAAGVMSGCLSPVWTPMHMKMQVVGFLPTAKEKGNKSAGRRADFRL
jgi:hypothetical protein